MGNFSLQALSDRARIANMDHWDVVLLAFAGYLAVTALVRLMIRRRDQLLDELGRQFKTERNRQTTERVGPEDRGDRNRAA